MAWEGINSLRPEYNPQRYVLFVPTKVFILFSYRDGLLGETEVFTV
jgi:hypothetical protein